MSDFFDKNTALVRVKIVELERLKEEIKYYRSALQSIVDYYPSNYDELENYAFSLKSFAILALEKHPDYQIAYEEI